MVSTIVRVRAYAIAGFAAAAVAATARPAAAQSDAPAPAPAAPIEAGVVEPAADAAPPGVDRPLLSVAVGMGGTFDDAGFRTGTQAVPAFFATAGVGDGFYGVDLGAFASSAAGRFRNDEPVDRLALDAFGVLRPAARFAPDDTRYRLRVLRSLAGELGLGLERDGRSMSSGSRFVVHTGARVEFPLTPAGQPSELRLRLCVQRRIGLYTPVVHTQANDLTRVGDTVGELYAALLVVF